jgi:hypothetical protein
MSSRARKKKAERNGNSLGVVPSPGGLAAAERSEGSPPGEPQRSAAAAKASADSGAASRPDPEVVAQAKRRTYTAEYKQRILLEAEAAAATRGGPSAIPSKKKIRSCAVRMRLTEDLRNAQIIIDVQKKVAALLGNPIPEQDPEDQS